MKIYQLLILALTGIALPLSAEPVGSAFTYQGSLNKAGAPVSAAHDFEFGLYGSAIGADQVGSTITLTDVGVLDGLFHVNLDFGAAAFGSEQRFLQINVRSAGLGAYTALSPRAAVMPAPVALSVAADGVDTAAIQDGAITREKLAASVRPKLQLSLTSDYLLPPIPILTFVPFTPDAPSDDILFTGGSLHVQTTGTYVLSTRLTVYNDLIEQPLGAEITLNSTTIRSLSDGLTSLPIGQTVLSSVEILQLQEGDVLSLHVRGFMGFPGLGLRGGPSRPTSLDIIRID